MRFGDTLKFLGPLVFIVAIGMGAVAWSKISKYHLPISYLIPALTTISPAADFFTTYRSIVGLSSQSKSRRNGRPLSRALLFFNLLWLILPAILTGYSAKYLGGQGCELRETWRSWHSTHDAAPIKAIQDSLKCCGLSTPKDMAYPFTYNPPKGSGKSKITPDTCAKLLTGNLDTATACFPSWEKEIQALGVLLVTANVILMVTKLVFLMLLGGSPEAAEKTFNSAGFPNYSDSRTVEEVEEEEEEEAARPEFRSRITNGTTETQPSRERDDSRTRLLPQENGGSHQAGIYDEAAWRD